MTRVLYLGSPDFAVAPLAILNDAGYTIVGVVTQPDRPAGRKRTLTPPPVKLAAQRLNIPLVQPQTLRDPAELDAIRALRPDVGIVVAYGEILRPAALEIPPLGYLNIHPSLLPLYRGPAPIAGAILAGDSETGVTVMQLDRGMDSGPILAQATVPLPHTARTGPLTEELMQLGARLLLDVLPRYVAGELALQPQDHSQATYTRMLKKSDGQIDWALPALVIERTIRAYDPWPGAFTWWNGQQLKLLSASIEADWSGHEPPGTIIAATDDGPLVATGSGALALHEVQPAGKRAMGGHAWLMGQRDVVGQRMGAA
jgi:methionyl-tRNA formyltransferase